MAALGIQTQIQRALVLQGKAAGWIVQLHRGNAQIGQDQIDPGEFGGGQNLRQSGEVAAMSGEGFEPESYIKRDYEKARAHKWYMTARLICVNDIYAFDPNAHPVMDDFVDIIGRNFRQPEEGLGYDNSPVAHMWRAMIRPAKYL